jgi:hypothetical protein
MIQIARTSRRGFKAVFPFDDEFHAKRAHTLLSEFVHGIEIAVSIRKLEGNKNGSCSSYN